mmetsp:Transcript_17223/g.25312  ORF Transcript_17223/g.25312 Transcript_17223/m.25312 type:complete len:218 (-) Transcript_17223:115-768(-)
MDSWYHDTRPAFLNKLLGHHDHNPQRQSIVRSVSWEGKRMIMNSNASQRTTPLRLPSITSQTGVTWSSATRKVAGWRLHQKDGHIKEDKGDILSARPLIVPPPLCRTNDSRTNLFRTSVFKSERNLHEQSLAEKTSLTTVGKPRWLRVPANKCLCVDRYALSRCSVCQSAHSVTPGVGVYAQTQTLVPKGVTNKPFYLKIRGEYFLDSTTQSLSARY